MIDDPTEVGCRALETSDGKKLAALFERCDGRAEMGFFDPFPLTLETAQRLASGPSLDRYYVAFSGNKIIALSMLRGWDEGYAVPSFGVMVDPDWHGRGVGSKLTDHTIAAAHDLGCESVRLSVYVANEQAATMYRRRGFVELARERVERENGADTRIVMIKHFRDADAGSD